MSQGPVRMDQVVLLCRCSQGCPISLVSQMFWLDCIFRLPRPKTSSSRTSRFTSVSRCGQLPDSFSHPMLGLRLPSPACFPPISISGGLGRQIEAKGRWAPRAALRGRQRRRARSWSPGRVINGALQALDGIYIEMYNILLSKKATHNTQQEIAATVSILVLVLYLLLPGR